MISVHFQGKPFNITVIQVYVPTTNAEEAEFEWFYEDLSGESHGGRSLVGYSPWGPKEMDTTEQLHFMAVLAKAQSCLGVQHSLSSYLQKD